jgi:hypothetical protein
VLSIRPEEDSLDEFIRADAGHQNRQLIEITGNTRIKRQPLTVFRGRFSLSQLQSSGDGTHQTTLYAGVPTIATSEGAPGDGGTLVALLDSTTAVMGAPDSVREAIGRWCQQESHPADIATRIQQLTGAYDNWFLILKPLANPDSSRPGIPLSVETN